MFLENDCQKEWRQNHCLINFRLLIKKTHGKPLTKWMFIVSAYPLISLLRISIFLLFSLQASN